MVAHRLDGATILVTAAAKAVCTAVQAALPHVGHLTLEAGSGYQLPLKEIPLRSDCRVRVSALSANPL